ncbi:lysophospholipid acyltransferase family protein [Gilvibacter sp.]|uniref:lysophospholipid acyltransferase family protein n=1 Tax=Gilvibacter sp. TaxID=2729997 RepID=UPI003F49D65B
MAKLLSYPISAIYYLVFGLTLVIFHPIQWIALRVFGYKAHKVTVDWLQFWLMAGTGILGTRYSFKNPHKSKIGTDRPLILVCNHQSLYDIPPLIWHFRKNHVKFISKKSLGKGIPSVSFNLRHGGSVLIDRKNAAQAVAAIANFGDYIETHKRAAVIFPEGTRSRTGQPKPFQSKGLLTLFEKIPSALIVPVSINNSWKLWRYGSFPLGLGNHVRFTVHDPILLETVEDRSALIGQLEKTVHDAIK